MSALGTKPRDYTLFFTKYVLITQIEFSYDYASNKLVFQYVEPHSERPKEALLGYNEFMQLEVMENETDFAILRKFYPVEKRKHDKLTLN